MRIGITYNLKQDGPAQAGVPDDFQEEFDSPATIDAIAKALQDLGHEAIKLGDGRELLERLLAQPPDVVFNIAEGQGIGRSREARVPAVLEMLRIPYTGSDPLTLAVTLDKDVAKRLVQSAGVTVPRGWVIEPGGGTDDDKSTLSLPVIVKPAWEGSSKGIRSHSVVDHFRDLPKIIESLRADHRQPVLVEEYIDGEELTVGVIGNKPPQVINIMRVVPQQQTKRFIYSLEIKRDWERQVRYECPAQLPAAVAEKVRQAALTAYRVLGCRDVARVDFRLRQGVPFFLEVNPLPGLNPQSGDLVLLSQASGWSYTQLIGTILQAAIDRQPQKSS
jgi:D-alanine-D-alanine ligase